MGLVRGAVRHYCRGGCSALVVCARRSRLVRGARAGAWCRVFPVSPFPPRVSCAVCGGPSCPGVPYPRSLVRHSMRSVRSAGSVRLPFWYYPRILCVCVRSRSRGVRAPPPPCVGVARAPRAVPSLGAGRAVPRGPCPSASPALVPCSIWLAWRGGGGPVPFPPYLAWGCAPPLGRVCASGAFQRLGVGSGWGGGLCAVPYDCAARGGPVGRGIALPRSVPLPSPGWQQSECLWRRSGHGGRGPRTAPVRARMLSPGFVPVASFCASAGLLVHRGSCGSRRLAAWRRALLPPPPPPGAAVLPGGGGTVPSALGGVEGQCLRCPQVGGGE